MGGGREKYEKLNNTVRRSTQPMGYCENVHGSVVSKTVCKNDFRCSADWATRTEDLLNLYFPDSLLEISGNAINRLPEPLSWSWTVSDVVHWVQYGLKLPQYTVIFKENNIDGKKLIFINCQTLPSMNITDFDHIKRIAKNVRRLYGLPPDTENTARLGGRRRSVHDVYGRYYAHLAAAKRTGGQATPPVESLFDYVRSVRMVSRPNRRRPTSTDDDCLSVRPPPSSSSPDVTVLARLSAVEYLRGGQCGHANRAVVRLRSTVCDGRRSAIGQDDGATDEVAGEAQ